MHTPADAALLEAALTGRISSVDIRFAASGTHSVAALREAMGRCVARNDGYSILNLLHSPAFDETDRLELLATALDRGLQGVACGVAASWRCCRGPRSSRDSNWLDARLNLIADVLDRLRSRDLITAILVEQLNRAHRVGVMRHWRAWHERLAGAVARHEDEYSRRLSSDSD